MTEEHAVTDARCLHPPSGTGIRTLSVDHAENAVRLGMRGIAAILRGCHDAPVTHDPSSVAPSALTDLAEIVHVTCPEDPSWLVAVQFRFDEGYLQVEVDPNDDTVEVSFDPLHRPPLRHWASGSVSSPMNQHYAGLLGRSSAWWWVLRNQQQYEDAFQIELGAPSSTMTLQYVAMASRLHLRHVNGK